jgi:hypothetical protein
MTLSLGGLVLVSCLILRWFTGSFLENESWSAQLLLLMILVTGGAVPFLALTWWLRVPELGWLLGARFLRS